MERIIDLKEYHTREQVDLARTSLYVKPLTHQHINEIELNFKDQSELDYWCGYTFIKTVPVSLVHEIIPISTNETIGVILFLNTSESLRLLVQDLRSNFHLITDTGQTISIKKTIEEILDTLRRKKN
ncbi:MAG: hypothetical protein V7750_00115 [Sneathiella sp.]